MEIWPITSQLKVYTVLIIMFCTFRDPTKPRIHLGVIASGRCVVGDDQMRQDFASQLSVVAYDQEFDAVVESIYGNRKDQYVLIRGICDYQ